MGEIKRSNMKPAKYWIAQYIGDLFRNEPKNIGVFIELNENTYAKFLGETESGDVDGRKLRGFNSPDVYRQWIDHWRKIIVSGKTENLVESSGSHFRVIEGGDIEGYENDSIEQITNSMYTMLVSEGGYLQATAELLEDLQTQIFSLENEIVNYFKLKDLFNESQVPHPIKKNVSVQGAHLIHKPSFTQQNGSLYIMETVDFTTLQKNRSRDHAGLSAYMFKDIKDSMKKVEPISIIKLNENDLEQEDVEYGYLMLKNESHIVNWLIERERVEFLGNCEKVAYTK
jgi:hypothetical protein